MNKRTKLILVIFLVVAVAAYYGYTEYNRQHQDLTESKADFTIDASTLIDAFEKDTAAASKNYIDKTISVTGAIKNVDTSGVITLGDSGAMSSVQCTMDKRHPVDYSLLREGSSVTIKGKCTGYNHDELLGTDVKLNFAVLEVNNNSK